MKPKSSQGLRKEDLDNMSCGAADCDEPHDVLMIYSSCHKTAKLEVAYLKPLGVMAIRCGQCEKLVATIAVAEGSIADAVLKN